MESSFDSFFIFVEGEVVVAESHYVGYLEISENGIELLEDRYRGERLAFLLFVKASYCQDIKNTREGLGWFNNFDFAGLSWVDAQVSGVVHIELDGISKS